MKLLFISRFSVCVICTFFIGNFTFAQEKDTSTNTLPVITVTGTRPAINEKVWKAFQNSFKDAKEAKWYKIDKDFLVKFIMQDQEQSALFNKKGTLMYNITYGAEKHLPEEIRTQVKSVYNEYDIIKVLSIREADRVIWVVNLEDSKNLLVVRIEDGEMEEAKHYKKTAM